MPTPTPTPAPTPTPTPTPVPTIPVGTGPDSTGLVVLDTRLQPLKTYNRAEFDTIADLSKIPSSSHPVIQEKIDNIQTVLKLFPVRPVISAFSQPQEQEGTPPEYWLAFGVKGEVSIARRVESILKFLRVKASWAEGLSRFAPELSAGFNVAPSWSTNETLMSGTIGIEMPKWLQEQFNDTIRAVTGLRIVGSEGFELSSQESWDPTQLYSRVDSVDSTKGFIKVGGGVYGDGVKIGVASKLSEWSIVVKIDGVTRLVNIYRLQKKIDLNSAAAAQGLGITFGPEGDLGDPIWAVADANGRPIDIDFFIDRATGRLFIGDEDVTDKTLDSGLYQAANQAEGTMGPDGEINITVTGIKSPLRRYETTGQGAGSYLDRDLGRSQAIDPETGSIVVTARAQRAGDRTTATIVPVDSITNEGRPNEATVLVYPEAGLGIEPNRIQYYSDGSVTIDGVKQSDVVAAELRRWNLNNINNPGEAVGSVFGNANGDLGVRITKGDKTRRYITEDGADHIYADDENYDVYVKDGVTEIKIRGNPLGFDFSDVGGMIGKQLGYRIAGDNVAGQIVASAFFQTLGNNLGDAIDELIGGGKSITDAVGDAFGTFDSEFLKNLKSAGLGAVSSFLTAELVKAIGLEGFAGELANTAAGAVIGQMVTNLTNLGTTFVENGVTKTTDLFSHVNPGMLVSAVGSFIGNKLADEIHHWDSIGGQIGAAVGSAILLSLDAEFIAWAAMSGNPYLIGVAVVVAILDTVIGNLIGGLIGSLFGGTPRSGADVSWNEATQQYAVANVWSKKGGSKDAARSLASSAAQTFNALLSASGGTLLNPSAVQTGNYGMRKSDYVYQRTSSRDQNNISFRVSSKDADGFARVVGYGVYQGLMDPDFQIVGGDFYIKRAIYNTLDQGGLDPAHFDTELLFGNISSAQSYEALLASSTTVSALVGANPESAFALETLLVLARADELGLTRRARSDWFGGYTFLLDQAQTSAANVSFGLESASSGDQVSRVISLGNYSMVDTIDVGGQSRIEAGDGADIIDLRSGSLANQTGYTVDGHLNDDIALDGSDFTGVNTTVSFAAGEWRKSVAVAVAADGIAESTEAFLGQLSNAQGVSIVGGEAVAIIIDGTAAKPTLMVGRSFAREGDGYAVFRVSLSQALASGDLTATLVLKDVRTAAADWAGGLEVSDDGVTWTAATTLSFSAGQTQKFVRVAVAADNGVDEEGAATNVEGSETFYLDLAVTAGQALIANPLDSDGLARVRGTGTILDASTGTLPLAWIDSVTVDEASGQAVFSVARSGAGSTGSLTFATADRRLLTLDIAATVEAGAGDDTIYASNLGDNILGGAGNDTIYGGRLDDWLLGGEGDDVLDAGTADPSALGGDGNYLHGGSGNDIVRGREGSDWLEGGAGTDTLIGGAGDDILAGGAGDGDDLKGGTGNDTYLVRLGDGADIAEEDASGAPVSTGTGDAVTQRMNAIQLWRSNPLAAGALRPDWIGTSAGVQQGAISGGEDSVVFGTGIDIGDVRLQRSGTSGAPGNDLIIQVMQTVGGVETFSGTQLVIRDWFSNPFKRVEWLRFADGNEIRIGDLTSFIVGGSGDDVLIGTAGNDFVYGGAGNDDLYLLAGDDVGNGGTGNDLVVGDVGRDLLIGGLGNDVLIGDAGQDALTGDAGADDLYGGADRDTLSGGRGDGDIVIGGGGDDTFRYSRGDGNDVYLDELANYWDVIWTSAGGWNTAAGYAYNEATSEVTGPGGVVIRKNLGTVAAPDFQWLGRYDYDSATQTLKLFNPPANATSITANAGTDTIEFGFGINLQDVILYRPNGTNDLVLAISKENDELADTSQAGDSITLKDWYLSPGQIEQLAFYQTGILNIAPGGTNLVAGTDGADGTLATPLSGSAGIDWITGGAGDDVIAGGTGNDILAGNSGFDTLRGEVGDDVLYGGAGNDVLDGGAGSDVLIGGTGQDTASYASASTAVRAQLSASWANAGDAVGDEYSDIEDLTGGSGADVLGGDAGDNVLTGGAGSDTLYGGAGDDTYVWNVGDGADTILEGGFVIDQAVTAAGELASGYNVSIWARTGQISTITGNAYWRLQITGPDGAIVYDFGSFNYPPNVEAPVPTPAAYTQSGWLGGFARTNGQQVTRQRIDTTVNGGNDTIEFGANISFNDLNFVFNSIDLTIRYNASSSSQVYVRDVLTNPVERMVLADGLAVSLRSVLISKTATPLVGTDLDDIVAGRWGNFVDDLSGGLGNDVLIGYAGNDLLYGNEGDDNFEGGLGADLLDGGSNSTDVGGGDTARYVRSTAAISIDLNLTTAQGGAAGSDSIGDVLVGIENIIGSAFDDTIYGDGGNNRLVGLDGKDTIVGGEGDDVLIGDGGRDVLYGGGGDDNISGGDDNDILRGSIGKDLLDGGADDDLLYGDEDDDTLQGGLGADALWGGDGKDVLNGGEGNDQLYGEAGDDTLAGGTGNDILSGDAGNDSYVFDRNSGQDTLTDADGTNAIVFDSSVRYDQIWLTRIGNDLRVAVIGGDTVITVTGFFLASGGSQVRSINTTTHSIFLNHPDTIALINAMTAATTTPAVTPASMPSAVSGLAAPNWHAGDKAAPTGPSTPLEITLSENSSFTFSGSYGVVDHDQNLTGYSVKTGAGPAHGTISNFNPATGAFLYTPLTDQSGSDSFTIVAQDADGQAVELKVAVTIMPINHAPANIAVKDGAALVVAEPASGAALVVGTAIGQIVASDIDGDSFTFSLSNDVGQRFSIDADGTVRVANPDAINFELAQSHVIRVRVTDARGAWRDQDFTVTVEDRNEANAMLPSFAFGVDENVTTGTLVGAVLATDADQAGAFASQRYYFWSGAAATSVSADGRYVIDAVTGRITTNRALNFEAGTPVTSYQVIARDNAGSGAYYEAQTTVTIGIRDVNEANSLSFVWAEIEEGIPAGTIVATASATDMDGPATLGAQQRYYFLNGGNASALSSDGRFAIDAITGQISITRPYDAETMGYSSGMFTIIARDNAGTGTYNQASAPFSAIFWDVNEPNSFPIDYGFNVQEGASIGSVVGSVAATDIDLMGPYNTQRYYFWAGGTASAVSVDGRYVIDEVTGEITVSSAIDYESGTPIRTYQVIARDNAGDGSYFQAQTTVTIAVGDINEAPTAFNWTPSVTTIAERDHIASGVTRPAIALGTVSVSDPDTPGSANATYVYAVNDARFEVVSGVLRLKQNALLDYEAGASVTVIVTATNQAPGGTSIQRSITFAISDQTDIFDGTAGADAIYGQSGINVINGYAGDDTLVGGDSSDSIRGGEGNDLILASGGNDVVFGEGGDDTIYGDNGHDFLYGGDGNDRLMGLEGSDTLYGEGGSDGVRAAGSSNVRGFEQMTGLMGGNGNDFLYGGDGDDYLDGGAGADLLNGGAGFDGVNYGFSGAAVNVNLATGVGHGGDAEGDTLTGIELVNGSNYNDTITGSAGSDVIYGGTGNDTIYGGAGNDYIFGGEGNDIIYAEAGDDFLDGGTGDDILNGGIDNDVYIVTRNSGNDVINNYDPTGDDIDVIGFQADGLSTEITDKDLWFQRIGDDLKISVLGINASVRVTDWFVVADADSRANHKIDFIIAGETYTREVNIDGLIALMAGKAMPGNLAMHQAMMNSDLQYQAIWATYWHKNGAPEIAEIAPTPINEGGTSTTNITVTDDITPNTLVQLSAVVIDGTNVVTNAGITFGPANAAGVRTMTINPVAHAGGVATIRVTATDAGGISSSRDFQIVVNATPDTPTIDLFSSPGGTSGGALAIPLNLAVGFPDNDGSEVHEIWITGVPAGVTLSAGTYDSATATWKLSPAQTVGLTLLTPAGWSADLSLTAIARATENGMTAVSAPMQIGIAINAAPTGATFTGSVTENAPNGTTVGTVVGIDPDAGDTMTYSMVDSAGGRFGVSLAGVVTVGDAALINFETATSHSITVRITDSRGEYIDRSFSIAVNNANEANSLPSPGYAFAVNENVVSGTLVGKVVASDLDAVATQYGQQRYYFLVNGAASATSGDGRYVINALSGEIRTNGTLNFELTGPSTSYVVIARDNAGLSGFNQAQTDVVIAVNNLNEQNHLSDEGYSFSIAEQQSYGTVVGTIQADDDDVSGVFASQRYYFWYNGNASSLSWDGRYQINATSGVITTNQVLDFEGDSPSRYYSVIARDNAGAGAYTQSSAQVLLGITNVNEAPLAPDGGQLRTVYLDETGLGANPANAGVIVATFDMKDPDNDTPALQFAAGGNPNGWFYIVGKTVRINPGFNFSYEALRDAGAVVVDRNGDGRKEALLADVWVRAFDGSLYSGDERLQVYISDVNETPYKPTALSTTILSETLNGDPSQGGRTAVQFTMTDPDTITEPGGVAPELVILGGNGNSWFEVVGNEIRFASWVNFSADWIRTYKGQYGVDADFSIDSDGDGLKEIRIATLTLAARDAGGLQSDSITYNVYIEDKNEAPTWANASPTFNLNENPGSYQLIDRVSGTDVDGSAADLRYAFANVTRYWDATLGSYATRTADQRFVMGEDGRVYVNAGQTFDYDPLDAQRSFSYATTITDRAGGANARSQSGSLTINLQDVNEAHTLTDASDSRPEVTKLQPLVPIFDLAAQMLHDPERNNMSWSFADGSHTNGIWTLTTDGKLTLTAGNADYEAITTRYETVSGYNWVDHGWGPEPEYYEYQVAVRDYSLATQVLAVTATDGVHSATANFTASISDVNEGPTLGWQPHFIVRDDQANGYLGTVTGIDPETGGGAVLYSISIKSSTENFLSPGSSSDVDNTGNPTLAINAQNGGVYFTTPGDGEWEGGIRSHPTLGGRWYYQLDYEVNVTMTDASGVSNTETFLITFLKHDTSGILPIVFDLDGDGLELIGFEDSTVRFDMDGDGIADQTGWVGADDGMLVLDRNGNGVIDDSSEISFTKDDASAITDLEGLRAWDSNRDGVLDAQDQDFDKFRIWRDANQNGISDAGELLSLADLGIVGLNLTLNLTGSELVDDVNVIYATTQYFRADGSSGTVGDVSLAFDPSRADDEETAGAGTPPANTTSNVTGTSGGTSGFSLAAPIVFDLDADGAPLVEISASTARFDMNGDGIADKTGWLEKGDAFLALDRNGNGTIDDISEISFVGDKAGAKTDLEGLAGFDSNGDGVLDGSDEKFVAFRLWVDANSNGKTDAGELLSLAEAGVTSIDLTGTATGAVAVNGQNIVYNSSTYALAGGKQGTLLDVGIAYKPLSAIPETEFQKVSWQKRIKDYRVTASGGTIHVVPRTAEGPLSADAGLVGAATTLTFSNQKVGMLSAILLDLDGDGLEARQAKKTDARFDMNGDGIADDTGWVAGGDGMLVIDRDGDGRITGASELSFLSEKDGAQNAWEGLATLDSSKDSKLTSADTRFDQLKVWIDRNGDGITQDGELKSLGDLGITEISLRSTSTNDTVKAGQNLALSTASFKWSNGVTATIGNVALAFTPSSGGSSGPGIEVVPAIPSDTPKETPYEVDPARAAAGLVQAMSVFGADASQSVLRKFDDGGATLNDWLVASAA